MQRIHTTPATRLQCPFCKYIWDYRGRFTRYATCSDCRRNVKIAENIVRLPMTESTSLEGLDSVIGKQHTTSGDASDNG